MKRALARLAPVPKHRSDAERQRVDLARRHQLHAQHAHARRERIARGANFRDARRRQRAIQIDRRRTAVNTFDLEPLGCRHGSLVQKKGGHAPHKQEHEAA